VTWLDLRDAGVGDRGAIVLAEMLTKNHVVTVLKLFDNPIRDRGVCALAKALRVNKSVKFLDVEYCSFGAKGAEALFQALQSNFFVTHLIVGRNDIFRRNEIIVGRNKIIDGAATALGQLLQINRVLEHIGLMSCSLSSKELIKIANGLKTNTALTLLDLSRNCFDDRGWISIAD
jgi:Ran GTPase-activating protein (RanGAP) involved in mRNA processing and transport